MAGGGGAWGSGKPPSLTDAHRGPGMAVPAHGYTGDVNPPAPPPHRSRHSRNPGSPGGPGSARGPGRPGARGEHATLLFNKPFGVLCQFSPADGRPCLADHVAVPDVYPAGRLDRDSEGLLVLTSDGRLQHRIADPARRLAKTYLAQVEGEPDEAMLTARRAGPVLADGPTRPCEARRVEAPDWLWPRDPPIRHRERIPTAWLEIVLTEGRNRQVRRMTAAVGLPTLRLVRLRIGDWTLEGLAPGQWRHLGKDEALR